MKGGEPLKTGTTEIVRGGGPDDSRSVTAARNNSQSEDVLRDGGSSALLRNATNRNKAKDITRDGGSKSSKPLKRKK